MIKCFRFRLRRSSRNLISIGIQSGLLERDGKVDSSTAAYDAMRANDDSALSEEERERTIAYIFSRNGDEIEFVD